MLTTDQSCNTNSSTFERLDHLPTALKSLPRWVLWKKIRKKGKTKDDKLPFYANGKPRSGAQGAPADLRQLTTFSIALAKLKASNGDYAGIGIAMLGDGVCGLDLDDCVKDGTREPWVNELIGDTYAELSPSGKGIRAFYRGELKDSKALDVGIETFCRSGFLTVTGNRVTANDVAALPDSIKAELSKLMGPAKLGQGRAEKLKERADDDPVLARLIELGLFVCDHGGGKIEITCPFEADHTTGGGKAATVYFLPHTNGYAQGHFVCKHRHCSEKEDEAFLAALGIGASIKGDAHVTFSEPKPEIQPRLEGFWEQWNRKPV